MAACIALDDAVQVRALAPQLVTKSLQTRGFVRTPSYCSGMRWPPPFSESDARAAVAESISWSAALRALGYEAKGANIRTLQRWVRQWGISTEHFDPTAARGIASAARARPLEEVMVEGSSYPRGKLKRRLYAAGLKQRRCELCGQGEMW